MDKPQKKVLKQNERNEKSKYNGYVRQIENTSFTLLVFSISVATGGEAAQFLKVLTETLSKKTSSSDVGPIKFLGERISSIICVQPFLLLEETPKMSSQPRQQLRLHERYGQHPLKSQA